MGTVVSSLSLSLSLSAPLRCVLDGFHFHQGK
jgi:hypothetical protein